MADHSSKRSRETCGFFLCDLLGLSSFTNHQSMKSFLCTEFVGERQMLRMENILVVSSLQSHCTEMALDTKFQSIPPPYETDIRVQHHSIKTGLLPSCLLQWEVRFSYPFKRSDIVMSILQTKHVLINPFLVSFYLHQLFTRFWVGACFMGLCSF